MDLLEYQGKQLFRGHGVPTPEGRDAASVAEAVETAEAPAYSHLKRGSTRLIGPNCPGILSPGKANVGIIPAQFLQGGQRGARVALRHAQSRGRDRVGVEGDRRRQGGGIGGEGVRVGRNPTQVAELAVEILGARV